MPNKKQHAADIKELHRNTVLKDLTDTDYEIRAAYRNAEGVFMSKGKKLQKAARDNLKERKNSKNPAEVQEFERLYKKVQQLKFNKISGYGEYKSPEEIDVELSDFTLFEDKKERTRFMDLFVSAESPMLAEKFVRAIDKVEEETDKLTIEYYKKTAEEYDKLSGWSKWWAKRLPASWYSKADLLAKKEAYEEVLTEYGYKPEEVRKDDYVFEPAIDADKILDEPDKERITVSEVEKGNQIEKAEMIGDVAPVNEKEIEGISVGGQNA